MILVRDCDLGPISRDLRMPGRPTRHSRSTSAKGNFSEHAGSVDPERPDESGQTNAGATAPVGKVKNVISVRLYGEGTRTAGSSGGDAPAKGAPRQSEAIGCVRPACACSALWRALTVEADGEHRPSPRAAFVRHDWPCDSSTAVRATAGVLVVLAARKRAPCAVAVGLAVTLSKRFPLLAEHDEVRSVGL